MDIWIRKDMELQCQRVIAKYQFTVLINIKSIVFVFFTETDSKYRKPLNSAILQLQEHGVLKKLKNKWWMQQRGGGTCNTDSKVKTDMVELGVENVGGVFVILIGGCACGLIIGITEFLWNVNTIALTERVSYLYNSILYIYFQFIGIF